MLPSVTNPKKDCHCEVRSKLVAMHYRPVFLLYTPLLKTHLFILIKLNGLLIFSVDEFKAKP